MPSIKGTNLAHTRDFVDSAYGAEGWARVAPLLSKEAREAIESVVAVGWYPAHLHLEFLRAIDRALGDGRGEILAKVAAHDAEYDVTRIHRILFRFANPGFILEKTGDIWGRFYDTGKWVTERPTPNTTVSTLTGFAIVDALYCLYLGGYFVRMFELIGARDVKLRHTQCRARGDAACRFEGSWR